MEHVGVAALSKELEAKRAAEASVADTEAAVTEAVSQFQGTAKSSGPSDPTRLELASGSVVSEAQTRAILATPKSPPRVPSALETGKAGKADPVLFRSRATQEALRVQMEFIAMGCGAEHAAWKAAAQGFVMTEEDLPGNPYLRTAGAGDMSYSPRNRSWG